ncbi:hypothetical protein [uncultured Bdellovibrio sp.]|uniref:hypothetical protein n=1 Tax=Bdellovibrio sp. HCB-162 TaxID=3394234 RepID=UPI0025CB833D|nr:hypothetical protein [uncultured Bdellovibrio sp.]
MFKFLRTDKCRRIFGIFQKTIIIMFFLVNVGIMITDGLPDRSALGARFIKLISRYQAFGMLYQPWSMFAPNPMNTNAFIQAELHFEDGTVEQWPLPRQTLMTGMRRVLVGDRYRLFGQETLLPNQNELAWFDISKYITRQIALRELDGHHRALKQIIFNRYSSVVRPPPEAPLIPHGTLSTYYKMDPVFYYVPTVEKVRYEAKNSL